MRPTAERPTAAPHNAPPAELARSPAAARIGRLAAASGLGLAHFEYRRHLRPPDHWAPPDRPDLFGETAWVAGRLVEPKYGPFRHDSPMASFHPGHRAKWTAHELCHALVGHAWRPDATPLFLALGCRLAELLPVALYYFLDEAGLRRCPDHAGAGPLFGAYCAACERAALDGPGPVDDRWFADGRAFVEAELAAVDRSRRLGRPVHHRYATLDLQSDALAYVDAHRRRLTSPEYRRYAERFPAPGRDHRTLDALEARVRALLDDLCGGPAAAPLAGDRWRWVSHDLGWRLTQIAAESDPELGDGLDRLIEALADNPTEAGVKRLIAGYRALHADWIMPEPEDAFAVGYPLPDLALGFAVDQAAEGVAQGMPATAELLGDALGPVVEAFVTGERATRGPIARRFARFLAAEAPGPAADLAAYEAAVAHPEAPDPAIDGFGPDAPPRDDRLQRPRGVELLAPAVDVRQLAARLRDDPDAVPDDLAALPEKPHRLAVRRTAGGDVIVAELSPAAAAALERLERGPAPASDLALAPDERRSLSALGFLAPAAWALGDDG